MPRGKKNDRSIFKVPPVSQRNLPRNAVGEVIVTDKPHNSLSTQCSKESCGS